MAELLPEDITALCSHAGLDSSRYNDLTLERAALCGEPEIEEHFDFSVVAQSHYRFFASVPSTGP